MKKTFVSDGGGSIVVLTGFMVAMVAGTVAFSTEYSRSSTAHDGMQDAADAAVLAAAQVYDETRNHATATGRAKEVFAENIGEDTSMRDLAIVLTVDVDQRVKIDVNARYDTVFGIIAPFDIDVTATAAISEEFLDVYLLLDRSASMLLAEEGPDMDDLKAITKPMLHAAFPGTEPGSRLGDGEPEGCAFACHILEDWQVDGKTAYQHALDAGITLRIHRVTDAAKDILTTTYREANDTTRIGIFDFAETTRTVVPATRDARRLQAALDTPYIYPVGYTHYVQMTNHVVAALGPSGSGRSQNSPRLLVVLITDGAYSRRMPAGDTYDMFDPAHCDRFKEQGYAVAVLNTRYDPLDDSGRYDYLIAPMAHRFVPTLEDCASPDLYFEVGSGGDIDRAFRDLAREIGPGPVLRLVQ